jgi:hypothetical protein
MKINKLIGAFGNLSQIAEGVKNKVFKKEHIENIADQRWSYCSTCPSLDVIGDDCAMKGTQPCCKDCGCSLGFKLRSLSTSCPQGKWDKVVPNKAAEDTIKQQIKKEEDAGNI